MNALDPDESLPLPHGTDVITKVSRAHLDEHVAAGTAGRVVGTHGDELDVLVLGVGVLRYARRDLVPFRSGQVRYAVAREAAFAALEPNVVLEAIVGSRAWGLAEAHSDTDVRGSFVLPFPWTARLGEAPEDLVSADGSTMHWEVAKLVTNALRADPNTLELLFVPGVRARDELGELILAEREAFVSARIHASFGQYALSQLKKLRRSLRLAEHRELVFTWLKETPAMSLDAAATRLADAARIVAPTREAAMLVAKEHLKQLYASLFDQGLIAEKKFEALANLVGGEAHEADLPRKLRPKNAYNLLRLLITATGWLQTGVPQFEMTGEVRDTLLAIKRGEVPLEDVLERAEALSHELDLAQRRTPLPERPDLARAQALLLRVRARAAARYLAREQGPFGTDAAAVPLPEWKA